MGKTRFSFDRVSLKFVEFSWFVMSDRTLVAWTRLQRQLRLWLWLDNVSTFLGIFIFRNFPTCMRYFLLLFAFSGCLFRCFLLNANKCHPLAKITTTTTNLFWEIFLPHFLQAANSKKYIWFLLGKRLSTDFPQVSQKKKNTNRLKIAFFAIFNKQIKIIYRQIIELIFLNLITFCFFVKIL